MILSLALALPAAVAAAPPAALPQTTVTLTATDGKCIASNSNTNWNDNRFRAYWNNSSQGFVDGFAKFDLSSIPDTATISAMTLRAYHEQGFSNPFSNPEVICYRSAGDSWTRGATDTHPGLNEALTPIQTGFPSGDQIPVDFVLDVNAVTWSTDLADDVLTLALRNEAGNVGRYSYVYFYSSDASPAPPELIVTYTDGPTLTVSNLVAGATASFDVSGATPNGPVVIGYSLAGAGPVTLASGACAGTTVDLSPPIEVLASLNANSSGDAGFSLTVPANASGVRIWFQAGDLATCTTTNGVAEVVG